MDNETNGSDTELHAVFANVERGVLVTREIGGASKPRIALIEGYDEGAIHLVVEASPGERVADEHAILVADGIDAVFFAEGAAIGRHDPKALRHWWSQERIALYPKLWHDRALLAVTMKPERLDTWSRATPMTSLMRAAVRAFRRGAPTDVGYESLHSVLLAHPERRPVGPDAVEIAGLESFPASDPPSFNPGHA